MVSILVGHKENGSGNTTVENKLNLDSQIHRCRSGPCLEEFYRESRDRFSLCLIPTPECSEYLSSSPSVHFQQWIGKSWNHGRSKPLDPHFQSTDLPTEESACMCLTTIPRDFSGTAPLALEAALSKSYHLRGWLTTDSIQFLLPYRRRTYSIPPQMLFLSLPSEQAHDLSP